MLPRKKNVCRSGARKFWPRCVPSKIGRCTHHCTVVGRTAGFSLLTRAAAASHEMVSSDTLSTTLELRDRIGQSESRAHAHRERSDGSEEGLELHDWAEKRLFGKIFWFVVLMRQEKAGPVVSKTDGSSDGDDEGKLLEENLLRFIQFPPASRVGYHVPSPLNELRFFGQRIATALQCDIEHAQEDLPHFHPVNKPSSRKGLPQNMCHSMLDFLKLTRMLSFAKSTELWTQRIRRISLRSCSGWILLHWWPS